MIIGSKKSGCFFSVLLFFWGWGWAGEEYQNFWNHIHFLDVPASLGLAFHPTGTGGQVEQRTSKPFGLHQFGELGGFGWFGMTPRHVKNAKWMVILLWDIYIFTHVVSRRFGNIHPNSRQLPKSCFSQEQR